MTDSAQTPGQQMRRVQVAAGDAALAFTCRVPQRWVQATLPQHAVDFANPAALLPLAIFSSAADAAAFSVAVRPAYETGAVSQWLTWLTEAQRLFGADVARPYALSDRTAVACTASERGPAGEMRLRLVMFEDGGNLFVLTVSAPAARWAELEGLLDPIARSFTLLGGRGSTVALSPAHARARDVLATAAGEPSTYATYASFSLADNAESLRASHPLNEELSAQGEGSPPPILSVDRRGRSATVRADAIAAALTVPLGWHVLDNSRCTLMIDPSRLIRFTFDRVQADARQVAAMLDGYLAEVAGEFPAAECARHELAGYVAVAVRGIESRGVPAERVLVIRPHPSQPGFLIRATVTAKPGDMPSMLDLLELLIVDLGAGQ